MHARHLASALALALIAFIGTATAAPVWLQDYEAPGNLDEPFNLKPDFSGSTNGILNASPITLDTADGALSSIQSAELSFQDDAAAAGNPVGSAYSVRFIPNPSANMDAENPSFATDGYVGFYLKAEPAAAAALLQVAPLLEDSSGTLGASGGLLKPVIADGLWHRYQWNMDNPAEFPNTFETFYGGTPAAETLDATAFFDSIAIVSFGVDGQASAVLNIDQIGYNNTGELPDTIIPEPASLGLMCLGFAGLFAIRRKSR